MTTTVVGFAKHGPFLDRLRELSGEQVIGMWPGVSDRALRGMLEEVAEEVGLIFIADEVELDRAFDVSAMARKMFPEVPIVLSTEMPDAVRTAARRVGVTETIPEAIPDLELKKLMRRHLGYGDVLDEPETVERSSKRREAEPPAGPAPEIEHRIFVILSPKGGVGKTTLSVNLAVAMSERYPLDTVLVDFDDQFGDVASALNINNAHSVDQAFKPAGGLHDSLIVQGLLSTHEKKLLVLPGSDSPAAMEKVSSSDAASLLTQLSADHSLVLVDTAAGITDLTLAALEVATDVIFVTNMDVSAIRAMRRAIELLNRINLLPMRQHLIVNLADPDAGLTTEDIERTLQREADATIVRSSEIALSMNVGKPLTGQRGTNVLKSGLIHFLDKALAETDGDAGHGQIFGARGRL